MWERHIPEVLSCYDRLSRYEGEKGVCIVYASMYGNTARAAKALSAALTERGVAHSIHNLCTGNVSYAYRDAFRYNTIIAGAPTYNNDIFPPVYNFMYGISARLLKNRHFASFGSFTWAGASVKLMNEMAAKLGSTSSRKVFPSLRPTHRTNATCPHLQTGLSPCCSFSYTLR